MILANIIENAFHPLIWVFLQILLGVHSVVGGSWGWAIIGLTLIVRSLTFPLTRQQFKGMAKMRLHAPEMAKIKERYKDDRQRQQEEMMKYYKEVGFNPLSTCLPLLLQLPVFISLVYMLRTDLKQHICTVAVKGHVALASVNCSIVGTTLKSTQTVLLKQQAIADKVVAKHASFLFVHDITAKASGVVLIVLMVLYVGSQVFTSAMMSVGNDRNQRLMAIGLPFIFVLFVIQFAAGLLVYWIATNLTMIPQQMYMLRKYGRPSGVKVATAAAGGGGSGARSPTGSKGNGKVPAGSAATAVRKPTGPPPSARQRARRKRSGRRR